MADHDVNAISVLIDLYGFAIDTQCWDLFDRVFTSDVEIDYTTQHWYGLESFKKDFAADHAPFDATQHAMTSKMVQVDSNTARASSIAHGGSSGKVPKAATFSRARGGTMIGCYAVRARG
jgi:hypothetical protein